MPNKKISQLDVRSSPTLADLLAIADPSTGYAYRITGTSLQTVLEIPNKVPYTGATASVNLGAYGITSDYLQLSTTPTASGAVGRTLWNDQIGSTETTLKGGSVVLKNGVDLVARVVNKVTPAATLTKATYKAVRVSGAQGQRLAIAYAQANNDNNSADTIGLVCETIAANQEGFIITVGQLTGINTTGSLQGETWADGDVLYLSPTTAGNLTNIKPNGSTGHIVVIGYVEYAHANNGSIYVKIMNGWELDELHNVYINAVANNQVLVYESATDLWKNKSIATILGYTPADDSLVVHLAGAENITGVKTFQNAIKTTTGNNLLNTGGGNTVIGYTADPATSTLYKLDVNGKTKTATLLVNDGGTYSIEYNASTTNGKLLSKGSYPSFTLQTAAGQNRVDISNGGPNAAIQMWYGTQSSIYLDTNADGYYSLGFAYGKTSAPVASAILELSSVSRGLLLPRMTTAQKNLITTPATSLLVYDTDLAAFQYYSGSAWTSLGGGGGISGSGTAGQVTYWSGTSAVTGSSNLFWDNTNGRLGIGLSSPAYTIDAQINSNSDPGLLKLRNLSAGSAAGTSFELYNNVGYVGFQVFSSGYTASGILQPNSARFRSSTALSNGFYIGTGAAGNLTLFTNDIERFKIFNSTGNTIIQNGGTFTDGGQRLQVIGSMRVGTTAASAMYWDDTNNRLGIGTSSPSTTLSIGTVTPTSIYNKGLSLSGSSGDIAVGVYNSSATGTAGFLLGESNTVYSAFFKWGSTYTGNYPASSIPLANSSQFQSGSTNNLPLIIQGTPIIFNAGNTSTNIAARLSIASFRFTTLANAHTDGTAILDVDGSTTSRASLRIRSGTAPTSPNDGDIWYDGTNIYIRVGTTTKTFTII